MAKKKAKKDDIFNEEEEVKGLDDETFQEHIKNEFGERAVQSCDTLEDPGPNLSGSLGLDIDFRIPFPAGRIIEVLGEEGSGKTSLILEILGQAQLQGKAVAYNNAERNLDRSLVDSIRTINPKDLRILEGSNGEENLQLVHKFLSNFPNSVVAVDSVDGIVPEAVLEGAIGDAAVGNLAKLMSDACRKLKEVCALNNATVIFINQIREKITTYGDPRTQSGGRALRFYASQRLRLEAVSKADQIKDSNGRIVGHNARYYIIKNKAAPPFISGSFPLMYGKGIYREYEVAKMLKDLGLVKKGGPGGHSIYIGDDDDNLKCYTMSQAASLFESDPKMYDKYYNLIMQNFS